MPDDLPEWALREARIILGDNHRNLWITENYGRVYLDEAIARALVAARCAGQEEMRERGLPLDEEPLT